MNYYFVLIFLLVVNVYSIDSGVSLSSCYFGRGTSYTYNGNGACGYGTFSGPILTSYGASLQLAAPSEAWWNFGAVCGECYELVGSKGIITVLIGDLCPAIGNEGNCDQNFINFDVTSEDSLDDELLIIGEQSSLDITWRKVSCDVTGNVKIFMEMASNIWWFSLVPFNHRISITKMEVLMSGSSSWQQLIRSNSARMIWNGPDEALFPISVRMESFDGQIITGTIESLIPGDVFTMNSQYIDPSTVPVPTSCFQYIPTGVIYWGDYMERFQSWSWGLLFGPDIVSCPKHSPSGCCKCLRVIYDKEVASSVLSLGRNQEIQIGWYLEFEFSVYVDSDSIEDVRLGVDVEFHSAIVFVDIHPNQWSTIIIALEPSASTYLSFNISSSEFSTRSFRISYICGSHNSMYFDHIHLKLNHEFIDSVRVSDVINFMCPYLHECKKDYTIIIISSIGSLFLILTIIYVILIYYKLVDNPFYKLKKHRTNENPNSHISATELVTYKTQNEIVKSNLSKHRSHRSRSPKKKKNNQT